MSSKARLFSWVVYAGIAVNLLLVVPAVFAPESVTEFFGLEPAVPAIWLRFSGWLLLLLSLFYIPAALDPERLIGIDAAIGAEGDAFAWSAGVFFTRLEDAIVNVTLGAGPGTFPPGVFVPAGGAFRQRQNAGSIDAAGVEAEAHGGFGAFAWRAALNYTDAEMRGGALDGLRPAQSPEWSATAGMSWDVFAATTLSYSMPKAFRRSPLLGLVSSITLPKES